MPSRHVIMTQLLQKLSKHNHHYCKNNSVSTFHNMLPLMTAFLAATGSKLLCKQNCFHHKLHLTELFLEQVSYELIHLPTYKVSQKLSCL